MVTACNASEWRQGIPGASGLGRLVVLVSSGLN